MQPRNVLAVLSSREDQVALRGILTGSAWRCRTILTPSEAKAAVRAEPTAVVITDCRLSDHFGWRDVLEVVQAESHPAKLIVADRLADERLWAEVLNVGARDLLATPFDRQEVLRVLQLAWISWASETPARVARTSRTYLRGRSAGAGWELPNVS